MTEIIAHRGASRACFENTLAAFERAMAEGADAIELDVHATRDGTVVVHHDAALRGRGRSDHTGAIGRGAGNLIAELTAETVAAERLPTGDRIPTLDETLALTSGRVTVYVEVKGHGIEGAVAACLERHPEANVAVHSFDHRVPVAVRAMRSGTSIGLLSASYPLDVASLLDGAAADALWQHTDMIDAALVRDVRARGARVIAWTENDPDRARALIAMGVDAICTDTPGLLRAALR